jgi:hypothetical protein
MVISEGINAMIPITHLGKSDVTHVEKNNGCAMVLDRLSQGLVVRIDLP